MVLWNRPSSWGEGCEQYMCWMGWIPLESDGGGSAPAPADVNVLQEQSLLLVIMSRFNHSMQSCQQQICSNATRWWSFFTVRSAPQTDKRILGIKSWVRPALASAESTGTGERLVFSTLMEVVCPAPVNDFYLQAPVWKGALKMTKCTYWFDFGWLLLLKSMTYYCISIYRSIVL